MTKLLKRTLIGMLLFAVCAPLCAMNDVHAGAGSDSENSDAEFGSLEDGDDEQQVASESSGLESEDTAEEEKDSRLPSRRATNSGASASPTRSTRRRGNQKGSNWKTRAAIFPLTPRPASDQSSRRGYPVFKRPYAVIFATAGAAFFTANDIRAYRRRNAALAANRKKEGNASIKPEGFFRWWYKKRVAWLWGGNR